MPFHIIRNDITKVAADAIVNTANPAPVIGSGTDHAIYEAAGAARLLEERKKIGNIRPGDAAQTPAFDLNARYIIHTVGPVWQGGEKGEFEILASCYRKSLLLADYLGCKSIAFPLISTGVYGFPKDKALETAFEEISEFLKLSEMQVTLVVFDKTAFDISKERLEDVRQFIDDNYVEEAHASEYRMPAGSSANMRRFEDVGSVFGRSEPVRSSGYAVDKSLIAKPEEAEESEEDEMAPLAAIEEDVPLETEADFDAYFHSLYEESITTEPDHETYQDSAPVFSKKSSRRSAPSLPSFAPRPSYTQADDLDAVIRTLGQTFQQKLLSLIDEKGYTDTQVYKNANIDRKLFSKIRCNENYKPSKSTALALSISLGLNLDETTDLLRRAGLALSPSSKADLIVKYCISHEVYDIYEVNALLFEYDQQLLGA